MNQESAPQTPFGYVQICMLLYALHSLSLQAAHAGLPAAQLPIFEFDGYGCWILVCNKANVDVLKCCSVGKGDVTGYRHCGHSGGVSL